MLRSNKRRMLTLSTLPLLWSSLSFAQDAAPEAEEADVAVTAETGGEAEAAAEAPEEAAADTEEAAPAEATEKDAAAEAAPQEESAAGQEAPAAEAEPEEAPEAEEAAPVAEPVPEAPAPEVASTPGLPLTVSTSTWSRFEVREGYDRLNVSRGRFSEGDLTVYRARLGLRTAPVKLTDGLDGIVQFTPQASGAWGTNGTIGENNVGIYEGYFKFQGDSASFQAGRFRMNYGDALVIGDLGWHQTARAFDGMRFSYQLDAGYIDAFVTQATLAGGPGAEGHPDINAPLFGGDYYFWGVYAGLGPMVKESMDLDVYLLGNSNRSYDIADPDPTLPAVNVAGATQVTVGARVKDKIGSFDYRAEAGLQFGARPQVTDAQKGFAYQADAEVGISPSKGLRFALSGALASGDDANTENYEGWTQLYPTGHKWLGLMDVAGARTNIGSVALHGKASITDSLTAKLDAHLFARPREGGLGQVGVGNLAGYEFDAQLVQKLGKPGTVRGLYGLYIPSTGHYASNELAHFLEIQAGLQF